MDAEKVLEFWFGQDRKRWFVKDPAFDEEIRGRFLPWYEKAFHGSFRHWHGEARSCLALVILFDQFPRNMFRGTARAFASDGLALASARTLVDKGWDATMTADERTFAYLPFEHSESLEDQELSMRLFQGNENEEWARKHWEIIRRFGRFPHRNAILGRKSTPEEIEFLKQPGSGF
ncbi:MAG TPA: DUF924 family protein [Burkholderiales bacterium]|jgi:uncharacterized protein (DUF924 family)|nr:DUF924 family protein [Burkholderiales bacterium]